MSFHKLRADYIFTGTKLLTDDAVLVTDANGVIEDIIPAADAGGDIQYMQGMLTPGFVNCHCHLELSHTRGSIPTGTGLINFLISVIQQRGGAAKEMIAAAATQAAQALYDTGTVAVGDICNTTDTLALKQNSPLHFYNFIESLGFTETKAVERFDFAKNIARQFTPPAAVVPHAPYSVSRQLFDCINGDAAGKTISIHNQESAPEDDLYISGQSDFTRLYSTLGINAAFFTASGKSALQTYLPWLGNAKNILLVHNTYIRQPDIDFCAQQSARINQHIFFCLCANANLYIEGCMPPVEMLRKNNCTIVLGTDSYASNQSLNMLEEIKTIQRNIPGIPTPEILQWATYNGATAMQMDSLLGSFEKGRQPGIVLINHIVQAGITEKSTATRIAPTTNK